MGMGPLECVCVTWIQEEKKLHHQDTFALNVKQGTILILSLSYYYYPPPFVIHLAYVISPQNKLSGSSA